MSLDGDAQRPTGCTRTSLMNTVCTAYPMLLLHLQLPPDVDLVKMFHDNPSCYKNQYRKCGFDAKIQLKFGTADQFPTGTFLKGVWLHSDAGPLIWTRLPSMTLKMFKTLKPLSTLTRRNKREVVPIDEARRRYCVMIANTWASFDLTMGVADWVEKWSDPYASLPVLTSDNRVVSSENDGHRFSNERAIRAIANHYEVDPDLYVDWCEHFANVRPGVGHVHPFWIALSRDY